MKTAGQVDALILEMQELFSAGLISRSEAAWNVALACDGWSYTYGAWGALCTPAERRKRYKYNPSHTAIKTKCKGFDSGNCTGCQWYPDGERTRTFDCRGFDDYIEKMWGFDLYGDTVSSQWNHASNWCAKGKVSDGIPDDVLVHLFICKDGTWTHTGFGFRGESCECSSGVQHFAPMKKNRWTHWAICACYADEYHAGNPPETAPIEPAKEDVDKLEYPTLQRSDKGEKVRLMQSLLLDRGYDLGKWGADGSFGSATESAVRAFQKASGLKADGICGPKTWAMLLAPVAQKFYTVTISHLSAEKADEVINKYGGSKMEE